MVVSLLNANPGRFSYSKNKCLLTQFCFENVEHPLLDKVMSSNQRHIGVQERHLMFKGAIQLNYNVLVFTKFHAMAMFQFA